MSLHAAGDLDDDNFTIFDLESILLTGEIVARQRDRQTREVKLVVTAQTMHEIERIKTLRKSIALDRSIPVAAFPKAAPNKSFQRTASGRR